MHVGEKPYVVTATGHAELASKALTIPAMTGMLDQLLPPESRQALEELGAVEYHLPEQEHAPGMQYSVVAARGGDDIWIEVRRRKAEPAHAPEPQAEYEVARHQPQANHLRLSVPAGGVDRFPLETSGPVAVHEPPDLLAVPPPESPAEEPPPLDLTTAEPLPELDFVPPVAAPAEPEPEAEPAPELALAPEPVPPPDDWDMPIASEWEAPAQEAAPPPAAAASETTVSSPESPGQPEAAAPPTEPVAEPGPSPAALEEDVHMFEHPQPRLHAVEPEREQPSEAARRPASPAPSRFDRTYEEPVTPAGRASGLSHLLQIAALQGASVLYVSAQARPSLRVDGEIRVLEHESPLTEAQLEEGLAAILPPGAQATPGDMQTCDVMGVGRVQVLGFRDHRGLGAMFRMLPARAITSEQMALGAPIQALCAETEGLLLLVGARSAGKSTLTASVVDQINRTRRDHVITIEQQIQFVHENRQSFVSQREARDEDAFAAAVRSALREAPDVLVIDPVASAETAALALQAASSGYFVIASITAPSTPAALARFIEFFGDGRNDARATLAEHLRGVVMQMLLRKTGGGRAAAREVLVNVPTVASMIAEGAFEQLPSVLNGGRRVGMVPLNDALLGLVQAGALDVRDAYRRSPDQAELLTMLKHAGLDTTFAERLA